MIYSSNLYAVPRVLCRSRNSIWAPLTRAAWSLSCMASGTVAEACLQTAAFTTLQWVDTWGRRGCHPLATPQWWGCPGAWGGQDRLEWGQGGPIPECRLSPTTWGSSCSTGSRPSWSVRFGVNELRTSNLLLKLSILRGFRTRLTLWWISSGPEIHIAAASFFIKHPSVSSAFFLLELHSVSEEKQPATYSYLWWGSSSVMTRLKAHSMLPSHPRKRCVHFSAT